MHEDFSVPDMYNVALTTLADAFSMSVTVKMNVNAMFSKRSAEQLTWKD